MKGCIHVYTGNGKGKTTASIGLSVRAAGAGIKVYIAQFMKKGDYSEIKGLRKLCDMITFEQFGQGKFVKGNPDHEDIKLAKQGVETVKKIISSGEYGVIVLEEVSVAVSCGIIPEEELLEIMDLKPEDVELVITGRKASASVIEKADLVTEMKEIKHYFKKGVKARVGIEM